MKLSKRVRRRRTHTNAPEHTMSCYAEGGGGGGGGEGGRADVFMLTRAD